MESIAYTEVDVLEEIPLYIDMRAFRSIQAIGMINAMVGFYFSRRNTYLLIKEADFDMEKKLLEAGIPTTNLIAVSSLLNVNIKKNGVVVLPFQRISLELVLLRMASKIKVWTFVHDLHFLSRRKLLQDDRGFFPKFVRKLVYIFTIKFCDQILCDSLLVQKQVKRIFNRESKKVRLLRLFQKSIVERIVESRRFDYFIKLDAREYKGFWALPWLVFDDKSPVVAIEEQFFDRAVKVLADVNPDATFVKVNTKSDADLVRVYKSSKAVLYLSRHEGFGFVPYEAGFFGAVPIVLCCSTYIQSSPAFLTLKFGGIINVPRMRSTSYSDSCFDLCSKHIAVF